jgi:hypothetical protein
MKNELEMKLQRCTFDIIDGLAGMHGSLSIVVPVLSTVDGQVSFGCCRPIAAMGIRRTIREFLQPEAEE